MKKSRKIAKSEHAKIVRMYEDGLVPMIKIAEMYGVSRQAIYLILKDRGVDTSKRKLEVSCANCGKHFKKVKSHVRNRRVHFCSRKCYHEFISKAENA